MAPYFYSAGSANGKIRAATGVKGLLFPDNDAAKAFGAFWATQDDSRIDAPTDAYADAVERLSSDSDFAEEIDHFSIVSQTGTARALYVWNILCRISFSAFYHRAKTIEPNKVRLIHREIVRYNFAHMHFFFAASPLLEETFEARTGQGGHHADLHGPDVQAARAFLETMDEVPSHAILAKIIDHMFKTLWSHRNNLGISIFYTKKMRAISFAEIALRLYVVLPAITSPQAILLLVRRFFELLFAMRGHFLRLVATGANDQKVNGLKSSRVPAILSPLGQIDPVAFSNNRKRWGSLELPRKNEQIAVQTILLWHVLSRCAQVAVMIKSNLDKAQIENHLQAQWDFYYPGFIKNLDVCRSARIIDYEIVDSIMGVRCQSPYLLSNTRHIASVGLKIFHSIGLKQMAVYETEGRLHDFSEAFGITYMQV